MNNTITRVPLSDRPQIAREKGEIEIFLNEIITGLDRLDATTSEFGAVLAPVLGSEPPQNPSENLKTNEPDSQMGTSLWKASRQLNDAIDRLQAIRNRICL